MSPGGLCIFYRFNFEELKFQFLKPQANHVDLQFLGGIGNALLLGKPLDVTKIQIRVADLHLKIIYRRAMAKQRQYLWKAKRNSWIYYINGMSSKTPSNVVWRRVQKLADKYIPAKTHL